MDINTHHAIGKYSELLQALIQDERDTAKNLAFIYKVDQLINGTPLSEFLQWNNSCLLYMTSKNENKFKYGQWFGEEDKEIKELAFEYIGKCKTEEEFNKSGEAGHIMRVFKTFLTDIHMKNWSYENIVVGQDEEGNNIKKMMRVPLGNYESDVFTLFDKECKLSIDVTWLPVQCKTEITTQVVPEKVAYSLNVSCPSS
jgi:hypothetical protein